MRTLILGYAKGFLTMFIKKKKNRSRTTSIVVAEKTKGSYKELVTIGIAKDANDIDSIVNDGREWISKEEFRRHPQLDLYGEEREACDREREEVVSVSAMLVYTRQKNIAQVFILERYFFVSIYPAAILGTCLSVFLVAVLQLC